MTDDELEARLRAADPAASTPPAEPDRVARLLEETMSHDLSTESREDGARGRSPLTWALAAASVAVIAGVAIFAFTIRDTEPSPSPHTAEAGSSVTELSAPDAGAARCMVPTARILERKPIAFDGTVEEVTDGLVTLAPTHWYAGEPTDLVTIEEPNLLSSLLSVEFEEDERYLVAASEDGQVMICGYSGPHTPRLANLYAEAFGG